MAVVIFAMSVCSFRPILSMRRQYSSYPAARQYVLRRSLGQAHLNWSGERNRQDAKSAKNSPSYCGTYEVGLG
jgi:hypothetical protein